MRVGAKEVYENEVIKELQEGFVLLVYDLPYYDKDRFLKSWYDWATGRLRSLGYPVQYSVVLLPENRVKEALETVEAIKRKLEWNGNRHLVQYVNIRIIRFSTKSVEDAKALLDLFKESLKETLKYAKEEALKRLREGGDYEKTRKYLQKIVRKLQRQDALRLLQRDPELRQLYASLRVLQAGY